MSVTIVHHFIWTLGRSDTVLPVGLATKAIQLCAAGLGAGAAPSGYPIVVHTGATLYHQPDSETDAEATVRDLLALGADFDAGPLAISGHDFATYGVTSASVFDPCALAHVDDRTTPAPMARATTISTVAALLKRAFAARITDTIRPLNATYGAVHSWHKVGQAVDFVPSAGVMSIDREQIRELFAANGLRLLELLGPGDPGHANHWHVAFARPGQIIDHLRPIEGDEDWIVTAANAGPAVAVPRAIDTPTAAGSSPSAEQAPPQWDVFAAADWRATHGGGS